MKRIRYLFLLIILGCNYEKNDEDTYYNGKLVKQGICMNYVIQVNDINFPQELIEKNGMMNLQELNMKMFLPWKVFVIFLKTLKKMIFLNLKSETTQKQIVLFVKLIHQYQKNILKFQLKPIKYN